MAFKDFVKTVKSEAGDAVEVTKLKAKISKEKANIKETYEAIGEIFYNKVKEGAQMDPEFSPLVGRWSDGDVCAEHTEGNRVSGHGSRHQGGQRGNRSGIGVYLRV